MKVPSYVPTPPPEGPDQIRWRKTNDALQRHADVLRNTLNFTDNFNAEVRQITFFHDDPVTIELREVQGNPVGMVILRSNLFDYYSLKWKVSAIPNSVDVAIKWDSAPAEAQIVDLLIIGV